MKLKIFLVGVGALLFCGCGVATSSKLQKDTTLRAVNELRTFSDITQIAFEWDAVDEAQVEGYLLFRQVGNNSFKEVAKVKDRFSTHYTDTGLEANLSYAYFLQVYGKNGVSEPSATVRARTLPKFASVSHIQVLDKLPNRVKLLWAPHSDLRVSGYIIERSAANEAKWHEVAFVKGRLSVEFIDSGLKDNSRFKYRIFAKTYEGLTSLASAEVTSQTKPLPPAVSGVSASFDLPRQIKLAWQYTAASDFSHFNIYRKSGFAYSLIAQSKTTTFTDKIGEDAESFSYKITAVDNDGLESHKSPEASGKTLDAPASPNINHIAQNGKAVVLSWSSADARSVGFVVQRINKKQIKEFSTKATSFTDNGIVSGEKYSYKVLAVDKFGLSSKASKEASLAVQ